MYTYCMKIYAVGKNSNIKIEAMNEHLFRMFNLKNNSVIGDMYVSRRNELYIADLEIEKAQRRKGYGKLFLDFAKKLSEEWGLGGKLRVLAGTKVTDTQNPSYVFYRKYGFTSDDKQVLNQIDDSIKTGNPLNYLKMPPIYMYYHP